MIEIAKQNTEFSRDFQIWVFAALFIGFAVKIPSTMPWHTWFTRCSRSGSNGWVDTLGWCDA